MNFKKLIALVLAAVMMMTVVSAFAVEPLEGALSVNGNLKITGLDDGDTVTYYQILKWDVSESTGDPENGWVWGEGIKATGSTLTNADKMAILGTTDQSGKINAALAGKIAGNVDTNKGKTDGTVSSAGEWTVTVQDAGLYMAIVTPKKAGTLYNPIFVAANWVGDGETADTLNEKTVTANVKDYSDTAMAKKTVLELDKKAIGKDKADGVTNNTLADGAYTTDVGEEMDFEVTTHVPKFATNYTKPVFKLTDKLDGLALTGANVKVYKYDNETVGAELVAGKDYNITGNEKDSTTYTVTFTMDYLWDNPNAVDGVTDIPELGQDIIIKYTAKVTDEAKKIVNQDSNTVDLVFSTTPDDEVGKGLLRDQTNHFTFSIDADLLGHSDVSGSSTEAIKVGVDKEGNYIVESKYYAWSNQTHGPLEGATFTLTTDAAGTKLYKNDLYPDGVNVTSDATGRITIKGLDAGTYYLKELTAPDGYIKMQDTVSVTITADITEEKTIVQEVNNAGETVEVTYKTNILNGYTVAFGNGASTTYTIDLSESSAEAIEADRKPASSDSDLKNTKGVELPSTGGIGTTLFYVIGGLMVLSAGIVLVSRKKAEE